MRKKIKMNLGGIPPNVSSLFNIASYMQGQQSLPGSGEGLDMLTGYDNSVFSQAPLGAPAGLNPLGPNTVTSSAYGMLDKSLQAPMDMQPFIDANTPAGTGTIGGSGMGMANIANMGLGMLENELALPENEFDQAQSLADKAKKATNLFQRGRDAVQHARNLKKARDIAKASTDTASLLTNLNAVPTSAATSAATEGAKTGVGQFIANAGASKMGTFLSSGAGAATTAGVGILGKYIQERDKRDGNYSNAGAKIGGAMQGAAMGSMLGPIGTVVGAGVGAAVGAAQRDKFIKQEKFDNLVERTNEKANDAEKDLAKRAVLQTYPTTGIRQQVYAYGGDTDPLKVLKRSFAGPLSSAVGKFKENLGENLAPFGYSIDASGNAKRVMSAGLGTPDYLSKRRISGDTANLPVPPEAIEERTDLWNMVLGLEQPYNTMKESKYRPTNESDSNSVYYSSPVTEEDLRKELDQGGLEAVDKIIETQGVKGGSNILGRYTVSKGQDENGHYISYYDVWDLNPISEGPGALRTLENAGQSLLGLEIPEIYGRIYYDPETGKPIEQKALGGPTDPIPTAQATIPEANTVADLYAQLNPGFAPLMANPPVSNDRLTSYTDAEMQAFNNRAIQERGNAATRQTVQNVADFHKEKPLDAVGMDLALLGQVPVIGEAADILNAGISGVRSLYNYAVGDTAKAAEQAGLAGLSLTSAIPFVGNATGATRLAHGAHSLAHGAHNVERGVIAAKGLKAGNYSSKKALGGHTNDPDYLAEGGEMIQHAPGDLPKTDNNGSVTPVTKTIARINGDKHTAPSGGVGMEGEKSARIYSDQLHVSEELLAELSKL